MILTVEYDVQKEGVEIYCDKEGLEVLLKKITLLANKGGHVHLMTPSWAGNELTEEKQGMDTELINHLKIMIKPE